MSPLSVHITPINCVWLLLHLALVSVPFPYTETSCGPSGHTALDLPLNQYITGTNTKTLRNAKANQVAILKRQPILVDELGSNQSLALRVSGTDQVCNELVM